MIDGAFIQSEQPGYFGYSQFGTFQGEQTQDAHRIFDGMERVIFFC